MPTTMSLIAKQTVGAGGVASVTFSNIPQTFTDLKVVFSVRNATTDNAVFISFNGSSSNFTNRRLYSSGGLYSFSGTSFFGYAVRSDHDANVFGNTNMYIPNYTGSTFKSISMDNITERNSQNTESALVAGLWSQTAAITSIGFAPGGGNFAEFTTFYLYGISNSTTTQNQTTPSALGGDVITTDGTYWYHAFKYSGSFTPLKNLTTDLLVVAGGGGAGFDLGGAGGAGGLLAFTSESLTTTGYTVTVGAGGSAGLSAGNGGNGGNSQFGSLTASVGGGGGQGDTIGASGNSGGSGGGASSGNGRTGGNGTSGQGYNGANAQASGSYIQAGTGGGGAGGVGFSHSNPSTPTGGNGGAGATSSLINAIGSATGTGQLVSGNYYYAGGGGGGTNASGTAGTGGNGGGGNGAKGSSSPSNIGNNGTANTGGGGGGGGINNGNGASGGSGIIIVRYAV